MTASPEGLERLRKVTVPSGAIRMAASVMIFSPEGIGGFFHLAWTVCLMRARYQEKSSAMPSGRPFLFHSADFDFMFGGRFGNGFRLGRGLGLGTGGGLGFWLRQGWSFHNWFGLNLLCFFPHGLGRNFGGQGLGYESRRSFDFGWLSLDGGSGRARAGAEGAEVDDFNRLDFLGVLAGGKRQADDSN